MQFSGWKELRIYILIHFGVEYVSYILKLQKASRHLAQHKTDRHYLKKCKEHGIIPKN